MSKFRQTRWNEPLSFEIGKSNRKGYIVPDFEKFIEQQKINLTDLLPKKMIREKTPNLPELSEVEVVRHFTRLSQLNYCVDLGLYPLGSCTMKYNPKINDALANLDSLTELHPYQDEDTVQGVLEILYTLGKWLAEITGTYEVSLQPAAGAHGEFLGALIMRSFHNMKGELSRRTEIIIPDSAHGTNPASATMAGFTTLVIPSDESGRIDVDVLKDVISNRTAGLMLTNPNTLGIFEENIEEISREIHNVGGLLYFDGANLNPILGKVRPGDMGFDIVHINIHKTFGTPHGGGGPGAGPIGVSKELAKFLPFPRIVFDGEVFHLNYDRPHSVGRIKSFFGNVPVLLRAYAYILSLGAEGLREAAEVSVLNANYLQKKILEIGDFELPYNSNIRRKHECVFKVGVALEEKGIRAYDVSKRLLDYGVHAPTICFPLIIKEALMIEPTESFEREELDRFASALKRIALEAKTNPKIVLNSPYNTAIGRLDEAKASHPKSMVLSWKMFTQKSKESSN